MRIVLRKLISLFLILYASASMAQQKQPKPVLYLLYDMQDTARFRPTVHDFVTGDTTYEYYMEYSYEDFPSPLKFIIKDYPSENRKPEVSYVSRDSVAQLPVKGIDWLERYFVKNDSIYTPDVACAILNTRFNIYLVVDDQKKEEVKIVKPDLCVSAFE